MKRTIKKQLCITEAKRERKKPERYDPKLFKKVLSGTPDYFYVSAHIQLQNKGKLPSVLCVGG